MIDHLSTYATDFAATKAFYEAALAPLGFAPQLEMTLDDDEAMPGRRLCAFGPEGRVASRVFTSVERRFFTINATDRAVLELFERYVRAWSTKDRQALEEIYSEELLVRDELSSQ